MPPRVIKYREKYDLLKGIIPPDTLSPIQERKDHQAQIPKNGYI